MQLEIGITNKLLKYIHSKIDVIDILDEYNLDLTYIQDERNSLSLNIWLAVDYVGKDGKSFIEKFLYESTSLSDLEKEILTENLSPMYPFLKSWALMEAGCILRIY